MNNFSDQELQSLVHMSGIMPCDRLPKPDPKAELISFLHQVSASITGAAKCGVDKVRSPLFPEYPMAVLQDAVVALQQLGYKAQFTTADPGTMYLEISGWEV